MIKKQIEKEDWRTDATVYKVAFWILVVHLLILVGFLLFTNYNEENYCNPCDYIASYPSWLAEGKLIGSGYVPNITTEIIIENNFTFVYRDGCGWCDKQKETLDMTILNMRGLVLKC